MSVELYPGKHLFIDEWRIEQMIAAKRVLHQPVKYHDNPVFSLANSWEDRGIEPSTVLYDAERGVFRMWYSGYGSTAIGTRVLGRDNPPSNVYETQICYAESTDCIHWDRPVVGAVEYEGAPDNNITIPSQRTPGTTDLCYLIDDPYEEDPQRRFKAMYLDQASEGEVGDGITPDTKIRLHAHSSDGLHWTRDPWEPNHVARLFMVVHYTDIEPTGPFDPDARYILFGQRGSPWKTRQVGRRDSNDFIHWSENRPVLESCLSDTPGLEFYYMSTAVVNRTYAGLHLGILGAYTTDLGLPFNPARNDGVTEAQLAYSRDSVRWQRWDEPFIARGEYGSCDWGGIYCRFPAIKDDCLYFIYVAHSSRHGHKEPPPTTNLATLRLDGFVSVQTEGYMPGTLTTRPHLFKADGLRVNVDAAAGTLTAQLQDETGRAVEGLADEDCDPIAEDAIDKPVTWKGRGDLSALRDRMIAIRFRFTHTVKLFSYTLNPVDG